MALAFPRFIAFMCPAHRSRFLLGAALAAVMALSAPPPAFALPQTELFNSSAVHLFSGSLGADGDGATVEVRWDPPAPLAPVHSITVQAWFTSWVAVWNPDPIGFPENNTFIVWTPWVYVWLPDGSFAWLNGSTQSLFRTGVGTVTASGRFDGYLQMSFFGPAALGPDPLAIFLRADTLTGTQFGGGGHAASFRAVVTYNVPDGGATWLILGAPVTVLIVARGRRVLPWGAA